MVKAQLTNLVWPLWHYHRSFVFEFALTFVFAFAFVFVYVFVFANSNITVTDWTAKFNSDQPSIHDTASQTSKSNNHPKINNQFKIIARHHSPELCFKLYGVICICICICVLFPEELKVPQMKDFGRNQMKSTHYNQSPRWSLS